MPRGDPHVCQAKDNLSSGTAPGAKFIPGVEWATLTRQALYPVPSSRLSAEVGEVWEAKGAPGVGGKHAERDEAKGLHRANPEALTAPRK